MKSYSEFVSESFVGGLRKAGAAIKSGVSSNVKGGIRNIKQVKNNPKVAAQRAGRQAARVASNPNARSVGSGIVGAVKGFGKREPAKLTAHDAKGDGFRKVFRRATSAIGKGINQGTKSFGKAKLAGRKIVQGKQTAGQTAPSKSSGGGVAKTTSGGGVQSDKPSTLTGRIGSALKDKAASKLGLSNRVQSRSDRASDLRTKRSTDQMKSGTYKIGQDKRTTADREISRKRQGEAAAAAYKAKATAQAKVRSDVKTKVDKETKQLSNKALPPGKEQKALPPAKPRKFGTDPDGTPSKGALARSSKKIRRGMMQQREDFSCWREQFIWETDKKYPEKVKEIKPMTGKNTIVINPEDESSKYTKKGF